MARLVLPAVAVLAAAMHMGPKAQSPTVAEMLQRYSGGSSVDDDVSQHLRTNAAFRTFLHEFERQARGVPAPLAAAFGLDAARLAFEEAPIVAGRDSTPNALAILEVACATLRDASKRPTDFELHWQALAADLITSSTGRRNGSAETFHWPTASAVAFDRHFEHVLARFGPDPQLALSSARYEQAQFYIWRLTWGGGARERRDLSRKPDGIRRLELVVARLTPLRLHPDIADEAYVRSGDALLHLDRTDEALELLSRRPSKDAKWDYIRRLVRARYFMQRGRTVDAAREYDAAILIAPRARPANLALAGLAYLAGRSDVAERLATASDASEPDPWVAYMYPGGMDLNARLAALRNDARGAH